MSPTYTWFIFLVRFPTRTLQSNKQCSLTGAETTATAIRMTLFCLSTKPRVLAKLRAEISRSRPSTPIRDAEARTLSYLQAIIKETLRLCPPITGIVLKDTPPEGDTWNSAHIPGGTVIGYSVMGVCMNKKIWGADVETFRPERFLEGTVEELKEREAVADTAFGYGRWRCLGRNIALMEMNKAVVEVSTFRGWRACSPFAGRCG